MRIGGMMAKKDERDLEKNENKVKSKPLKKLVTEKQKEVKHDMKKFTKDS